MIEQFLNDKLFCAVICVSIVCGLILLCLLRRLIQHYYPNALLIYPIASRTMRRQPGKLSAHAALNSSLASADKIVKSIVVW